MASERQIHVGPLPIGGGAPVAVQTMTKTETANLDATMRQIREVAEAGADIVRVAVPREQDVEALKTIVAESPIPVIADIHFNHTLALKAIEAGAHCVRLNPGNIGGPDKVAEVIALAKRHGTPLRVGVNSGSLPKHLRQLEFDDPVEALVTAAVETVELMERLDFTNFKVSMKSTSVPNTIASNRRLSERIPYPLHLGITGAKDMGMIYSKGEPLKKVPTEQLVDELFKEIDRYYAAGKRVQRDETAAAQAREWLVENEDASAMTPERIAALEATAAENDASAGAVLEAMLEPAPAPAGLDESASPVAGRRFSRS